mgnify:CR=1 FL=1
MVTLHALVSLAGVDRYRLTEELQRSWAAPTQVHVCEFHGDKSPDQNINSLVRYCLKHQTDTATTVCHAEPWDISWKTEYYEYLYRWSKGFQSLRVWVKPRAAEPARSQDARTGRHSAIELERPELSLWVSPPSPCAWSEVQQPVFGFAQHPAVLVVAQIEKQPNGRSWPVDGCVIRHTWVR